MFEQQKHRKIFIPVVAFLIIVSIVFYFSDRLTLYFFTATKYSKTKTPEMYVIPNAREIQLSNETIDTPYLLSYENVKLKIPWELKEQSESILSTFYVFRNKKGIVISQQGKDDPLCHTHRPLLQLSSLREPLPLPLLPMFALTAQRSSLRTMVVVVVVHKNDLRQSIGLLSE